MPLTSPGTNTYQMLVGLKLDVEDMIQFISPSDIPFQGQAHGAVDAVGLPVGTCFEKKYQWLDETLLTPRSVLSVAAITADTTITLAVGDQLKFQTGDMILIGAEYMRVTGYGAANVLNVTRAVVGVAAQYAIGVDVIGVGSILPEGSVPPTARFLDRNIRSNVTEIFGPYKIESTNSDLAVQKYGITNEFDHQVANRIKEAGVAIDQAIAYGGLLEDTGNGWRAMAGILSMITQNIDSVTTNAISLDAINIQMQATFTAGGMPDTFMCAATTKRKVSGFTGAGQGATTLINRDGSDNTIGRRITLLETDFGPIDVKLNRWFRTADGLLFNRNQCEIQTLRPLQYHPLAIVGDSIPGMLVAEKGMKFYRQAHAAKFTTLA